MEWLPAHMPASAPLNADRISTATQYAGMAQTVATLPSRRAGLAPEGRNEGTSGAGSMIRLSKWEYVQRESRVSRPDQNVEISESPVEISHPKRQARM
ncbi:hypothetical protein D3C72_2054230 [compost metagenome]